MVDNLIVELNKAVYKVVGANIALSRSIAGGDMHQAFELQLENGQSVFAKCNRFESAEMLEQELFALQKIQGIGEILTPKSVAFLAGETRSYLLLEWLDLEPSGDQYRLGLQLAKMHRHTNCRYGWQNDNFIGSTPQSNAWNDNWADFWWQNRLSPQLKMTGSKQLLSFENDLCCASYTLLKNHHPEASLLHGDLWGGNKGFCDGEPVIFDPASYYGDRETDIAFTYVFGGFTSDFYAGYEAEWPLPHNHPDRRALYNLYHLFNHCNLFGTSYLGNCLQAIEDVIEIAQL